MDNTAGDERLVLAYARLQIVVGLIAVTLPLIVGVGGRILDGNPLEGSISAYYYRSTGNYFVGALSALGVFLLSYNYPPRPRYEWDWRLSNLAALAAFGVALFPTARNGSNIVGKVHITCATVLFILLAVFSFFIFTQTDTNRPTVEKKRRNVLYRVCGVVIALAIGIGGLSNALKPPDAWHMFFWSETVAVFAFGVSWLVKGGFLGILADPKA